MIEQKAAHLLDMLLERSREDGVEWEATDHPNTFQAPFPSYSIRITREYEETGPNEVDVYYELKIYNHEGILIEEIYPYDLQKYTSSSPASSMDELFTLARRKAFGVEYALDELLDNLSKGMRNPERSIRMDLLKRIENLEKLEANLAKYGAAQVPITLVNEIENERKAVAILEDKLRLLKVRRDS